MNTNIFQNNKYTNLYYRIIAKHGNKEKPGTGYEEHHKIPRSLGGSDLPENLVFLSMKAHFVAHRVLMKAVKPEHRQKMVAAVVAFRMINNPERRAIHKKIVSGRGYAAVRAEFTTYVSSHMKTLKWFNNGVTSMRLPHDADIEGLVPGRLKLPSRAGVKYITDGVQTKRIKADAPLPEGWVYGQKPERVNQISEQGKNHKMGSGAGRVWINNGTENKYVYAEQGIPEGWVKGRLKTGKFDPSVMRSKSSGTKGKTWVVKELSASDVQSPA